MSIVGFTHPWLLLLLPLALAPLAVRSVDRVAHPGLVLRDAASTCVEAGIRCLGAIAIAALILGLAGAHLEAHTVMRKINGAQVVIVLDHSRSMNYPFAGEVAGYGQVSKRQAASQLLLDFVKHSSHAIFGTVLFSTAPMFAMPLTSSDAAVRAALKAAGEKGLTMTGIASALGMATEMFHGSGNKKGARVVLLVSDGAAILSDEEVRAVRTWFEGSGLRLAWIYIRQKEQAPLASANQEEKVLAEKQPQQLLHEFFLSLDMPYHAYPAEDPKAMRQAIEQVDALLTSSVPIPVTVKRQPLAHVLYLTALAALALLLLTRAAAVWRWT